MDNVKLEPGGVIIDHKTGEVGLLMRRYDIIEHIPLTLDLISDNEEGLYNSHCDVHTCVCYVVCDTRRLALALWD